MIFPARLKGIRCLVKVTEAPTISFQLLHPDTKQPWPLAAPLLTPHAIKTLHEDHHLMKQAELYLPD